MLTTCTHSSQPVCPAQVSPARAEAGLSRLRHVTNTGGGLATAGAPLAVEISLRDRFGNVASGAAEAGECSAGAGLVLALKEDRVSHAVPLQSSRVVPHNP